MFLEIELDFLLIKAQFRANKLNKTKLWVIKMSFYNVTKYNNLQFLAGFHLFAAKVI